MSRAPILNVHDFHTLIVRFIRTRRAWLRILHSGLLPTFSLLFVVFFCSVVIIALSAYYRPFGGCINERGIEGISGGMRNCWLLLENEEVGC